MTTLSLCHDDAKAEIIKDVLEECAVQLKLNKNSPDETPRIHAPPERIQPWSQVQPMEEQTMKLQSDELDSSGGESSNQGLGLTIQSLDIIPGPPRGRSFTSSGLRRCSCEGKCECLPDPSALFDEQYTPSEVSDENQWRDIIDWSGGQSSSF